MSPRQTLSNRFSQLFNFIRKNKYYVLPVAVGLLAAIAAVIVPAFFIGGPIILIAMTAIQFAALFAMITYGIMKLVDFCTRPKLEIDPQVIKEAVKASTPNLENFKLNVEPLITQKVTLDIPAVELNRPINSASSSASIMTMVKHVLPDGRIILKGGSLAHSEAYDFIFEKLKSYKKNAGDKLALLRQACEMEPEKRIRMLTVHAKTFSIFKNEDDDFQLIGPDNEITEETRHLILNAVNVKGGVGLEIQEPAEMVPATTLASK